MKLNLMPCAFCLSNRVRFYCCHDDRDTYLAVSCDRCAAQGPAARGPIGHDDDVTEHMRIEAVADWNRIWDQIAGPPKVAATFESLPLEIQRKRRLQRRRRAEKASAEPARAAMPAAGDHAPGTGHNGHSGLVYSSRSAP